MIGYSHIQTFDGERYVFQPAACDYILVEVSSTLCALLLYALLPFCVATFSEKCEYINPPKIKQKYIKQKYIKQCFLKILIILVHL